MKVQGRISRRKPLVSLACALAMCACATGPSAHAGRLQVLRPDPGLGDFPPVMNSGAYRRVHPHRRHVLRRKSTRVVRLIDVGTNSVCVTTWAVPTADDVPIYPVDAFPSKSHCFGS